MAQKMNPDDAAFIEHATKRYRRAVGARRDQRRLAGDRSGELVAVWAPAFGRSTLLRVAAGSSARKRDVSFEGRIWLAGATASWQPHRLLPDGLRLRRRGSSSSTSPRTSRPARLADGRDAPSAGDARSRRRRALRPARVSRARRCEIAHVAIASALVTSPALLVIDERPTASICSKRDPSSRCCARSPTKARRC